MLKTFATLALTSPVPHVTVITMNRPAAMNAMNTQMMEDLRDCFAHFYVEADAARCLVLTGAGDKAFCAGADMAAAARHRRADHPRHAGVSGTRDRGRQRRGLCRRL
jgi:enoyl-CoA hydratase/carnithine racemase